jgi:hypothetical protein
LFEDELDESAHGLGAKTAALRLACQGEANLGPPVIRTDADTHVPNEFVRGTESDTELEPRCARKQGNLAHLLNEPSSLVVWLRFPALVPAHARIVSVGLKSAQVGERQSPQHDSADRARKGIRLHSLTSYPRALQQVEMPQGLSILARHASVSPIVSLRAD